MSVSASAAASRFSARSVHLMTRLGMELRQIADLQELVTPEHDDIASALHLALDLGWLNNSQRSNGIAPACFERQNAIVP